MLDYENREGLFVFLLGMVLLVIVGVAATLLIDGSSDSSKDEDVLRNDISKNDQRIELHKKDAE